MGHIQNVLYFRINGTNLTKEGDGGRTPATTKLLGRYDSGMSHI